MKRLSAVIVGLLLLMILHPLFQMIRSQNRATKILSYLGDLIVNGSSIKGQIGEPKLNAEALIPDLHDPKTGIKIEIHNEVAPRGWRQVLLETRSGKIRPKGS